MDKVWSYILPLPVESVEQLKVLLSVFSSEITIEILRNVRIEGKTYQKELLEELPYSSKTVIGKLKQLVSAGVLREGLEQRKTKGKTVWVKWYTPTFIGRWIITLLTPPEEIDPEKFSALSKELFRLYAGSLAEFCLRYKSGLGEYHDILDKEYLRRVPQMLCKPRGGIDVAVFDAVFTRLVIHVDNISRISEAERVSVESSCPSVTILRELRKLGVKSMLISKLGDDSAARRILDSLLSDRVCFISASISSGRVTPCVVVLVDRKGRTKAIPVSESPLLLSSPSEVEWRVLDKCGAVYMGEISIELAGLLASYSKNRRRLVVYRPYLLFSKPRIEELENLARHLDVLIVDSGRDWLDEEKAKILLERGVKSIIMLRYGEANLHVKGETLRVPLKAGFSADIFTAHLLKNLLERELYEALTKSLNTFKRGGNH